MVFTHLFSEIFDNISIDIKYGTPCTDTLNPRLNPGTDIEFAVIFKLRRQFPF